MARFDLLHEEVLRILKLIGRERIDILNLPFMNSALEADSAYLDKMGENIRRLKQEGLIGYVATDTLGGRGACCAAIESGHFDAVYTNYNITEPHIGDIIIKAAAKQGMGVIVREAFVKGRLFAMAKQAGIDDAAKVARASVKWICANAHVSSLVVGVSSVSQLDANCAAAAEPQPDDEEREILAKIRRSDLYKQEYDKKVEHFFGNKGF
jgi:aryl-alcohol dehydrogenase-like predicted oxidoreductase